MTTIAYKDGILAADTQQTTGNTKFLCRKIEFLPDGKIISCAGNTSDINIFREWLTDIKPKKKKPKFDKEFECILIDTDSKLYWYDRHLDKNLIEQSYYAIGNGWQIAMSAMHLGFPAEEAVNLAGELNI